VSTLARRIRTSPQDVAVAVPWYRLRKIISPARGQLVVVFGLPGVGKSIFALHWALAQRLSLLLSLDTDLRTQSLRAAAALSGRRIVEIANSSMPQAWELLLERKAKHVRAYDLYLQPKELLDLLLAEEEYWGSTPDMVVVDNVSNLAKEAEYAEYRRLMIELHQVARKSGSCVVVLHHVTRKVDPGKMPSLTGGQFAGEHEAEVVLGLWRPQRDKLNVSILKNRQGEADPTGGLYVQLSFDPERVALHG
jgi:predicted ATP-dependent serine protease